MTAEGETMEMDTRSTGNVKYRMDHDKIQMACLLTTTAEDGTKVDTKMWMKDGWVYTSTNDGTEKMDIKYPVSDELAALESLGIVEVDTMNVSGLAMIDSISSNKNGSNTEYTVVIGENLGGMMESVIDLMGEEAAGMEMNISGISAVYTVDANGNLKKVTMVFSADMKMDLPMEDGTVLSMDAAYDYEMTMTVNAMGNNVKITYPDFSGFQEIDPAQLENAVA
jgi:hypothetical protein